MNTELLISAAFLYLLANSVLYIIMGSMGAEVSRPENYHAGHALMGVAMLVFLLYVAWG